MEEGQTFFNVHAQEEDFERRRPQKPTSSATTSRQESCATNTNDDDDFENDNGSAGAGAEDESEDVGGENPEISTTPNLSNLSCPYCSFLGKSGRQFERHLDEHAQRSARNPWRTCDLARARGTVGSMRRTKPEKSWIPTRRCGVCNVS